MRRSALPALLCLVLVAAAACGGSGDDDGTATRTGTTNTGAAPAEPSEEVGRVMVSLRPQGSQGQPGQATLLRASEGNTTTVRIELGNEPAEAPAHPAHVHEGTCDDLDPTPKFALEDVRRGRSETELRVSLQQLLGEEMAINVHRSAKKLDDYVACGEIVSSGG